EVLREAFANGDLKVMGEIGAQYHGLDPSDEWLSPTWRWPRSSISRSASTPGWRPRARRNAAAPISACRSAIPRGSSPAQAPPEAVGLDGARQLAVPGGDQGDPLHVPEGARRPLGDLQDHPAAGIPRPPAGLV